MSKVNSERGGCVDVFHASLLRDARYSGEYDFPVIKDQHEVPRRMIPFSKALREKKDNPLICTGSLYLAGEILAMEKRLRSGLPHLGSAG